MGYWLHYFENRSTPDVQPDGKSPKPGKGWGKYQGKKRPGEADMKKIQNVVSRGQSVSDNWITTRFDGKASSDAGAKRSKYRPALARLQKRAQERRKAGVKVLAARKRG